MENSRLPIDVCEEVVDMIKTDIADYDIFNKRLRRPYRTLLACALACKKWQSRSQYNIFRSVVFNDTKQVDLLIRTLRDNPGLASVVTEIRTPWDFEYPVYIPLGRLSNLVPMCRNLNLDLGRAYPAKYILNSVTSFSRTVSTMNLQFCSHSFSTIFHFLWSFPELRYLRLLIFIQTPKLSEFLSNRLGAMRPPAACTNLKELDLYVRE